MADSVYQKRQEAAEQAESIRQRKEALPDNRASAGASALVDNRLAQCVQKPNNTGLPDQLKSGIESLSGMAMDNVKVHYNSSKPAQLNAHAYAQGTDIHLAPGKEEHLPHEAWHVVQQAQGRVKPTLQMKSGVPVNDDQGLEREADVMGARAGLTAEGGLYANAQNALEHTGVGGLSVIQSGIRVAQRLTGAGLLGGHDEILGEAAGDRRDAARRIAEYINLRARQTGHGEVQTSSGLGVNNPGNLYVRCNYEGDGDGETYLAAWAEMTKEGGGYIKRVKIVENGHSVMDRVMQSTEPTDFAKALIADIRGEKGGGGNGGKGGKDGKGGKKEKGEKGLEGGNSYASTHTTAETDGDYLKVEGHEEKDADNLTKIMGEGARFGWLAARLAGYETGNNATGILQCSIDIHNVGTLSANPTFQQLWGSWDVAFGRAYMGTEAAAVAILNARLQAGLRTPQASQEQDATDESALHSGAQAGHQVTSLLAKNGTVALVENNSDAGIKAYKIISSLGMTWVAS